MNDDVPAALHHGKNLNCVIQALINACSGDSSQFGNRMIILAYTITATAHVDLAKLRTCMAPSDWDEFATAARAMSREIEAELCA